MVARKLTIRARLSASHKWTERYKGMLRADTIEALLSLIDNHLREYLVRGYEVKMEVVE